MMAGQRMGGYLLDTNVVLIAGFAPEKLSRSVRKAIEKGPAYISVISYWEVTIKRMKGNLDVGDVEHWWADSIKTMALSTLLFRPEHVAAIRRLRPHHSDPFDRALIGVALAEELAILSTDGGFRAYADDGLIVIG